MTGVEGSSQVRRLLSSAESFAKSGLQARLDDNPAVYLLHAATALELLAKAYLASLSGSLIAAPKHLDSLLHCSGLSSRARTPPSRVRTITMTEALERVGYVEPTFAAQRPELRLLADVRNGVAHAGLIEPAAGEAVLAPFLRACDFLIVKVPDADRATFWGDHLGPVDARLSESAEEIQVFIADAIAAARSSFERQYGPMVDAARVVALAAVENSYDVTKYEQSLTDCPACGRQALTSGNYDVDWEAEWDQEGSRGEPFIVGAYPVVSYFPAYLHCRVCDLELDGEEQLDAAGIERSWKIEDADAADFYEEEYE